MSFWRHEEIYRSDVGLGKAGNAKGCRRSPHSSAAMSFQSAIPRQVALQQSLPPLRRLENDSQQPMLPYNDFAANGNNPLNSVSQPKGALQYDPLTVAKRLLYIAKRVLVRDKQHGRVMFVRDGSGNWHNIWLVAADRMQKHILMQLVAQFIESRGCDAIIDIGEMWIANMPAKTEEAYLRDRSEALGVLIATRDGLLRQYLTPVTRGRFGGIKLGDTKELDVPVLSYLRPIIEVWRKQGTFRAPDGTESQVWEPDVLDLCPCGSSQRYGECCRQPLSKLRAGRS